MKRILFTLTALLVFAAPAAYGQGAANCAAPLLISSGAYGLLLRDVPAYAEPSFDAGSMNPGDMAAGEQFQVAAGIEPQCVDGVWWVTVSSISNYGWIPEQIDGDYIFEPFVFTPEAPIPFDVPMQEPAISALDVPLPTVAPSENPTSIDVPFAAWDWEAFTANSWMDAPDPLALVLPDAYAGDLPALPVDLSNVHFLQDANLNDAQLALLAQNGFVVVPSSYQQFDDVYRDLEGTWNHTEGKADFITTDAMLHTLFLAYQNALMFLESSVFYGDTANFLMQGYQTAEVQAQEAVGTRVEASARNAAVYYAVALMLIEPGQDFYVQGYEQTPVFGEGDNSPRSVLAEADPTILAEAQPIVDLIMAGSGREKVSILEDYTEDFSQYQPRSYYAGDPLLEAYFRTMMWLGRITFVTNSIDDTTTGTLVLRALYRSPEGYTSWQHLAETLDFLVGPVDDYGPKDYLPLAQENFGENLMLGLINDVDYMFYFRADVALLPAPRINSIPIPAGNMTPDELQEQTRGFRLFGQRFTFDGYVMQQLIYPEVGTNDFSRALPLGLDVPAVLGSDMAFALAENAGATEYEGYTEHTAALRDEVNGMSADDWLENLYGGWLWTLQSLVVRDSDLVPPMMQTDAWKRKELTTFLGSFTELKHATLLYAEQPMGGLGGGGMEPPVISYSYIEPNPQAFVRLAVVSALLRQGLVERGYLDTDGNYNGLSAVGNVLQLLAEFSARFAEMARKEVAGEPLSHDELYFLQENFGSNLWSLRYFIEEWITDPPENTAIVADVASNAASEEALELAIANPDLIYVITNSPYGLQVTRGAVFSYHEFIVPIDERMTDDEWREQVAAGELPPRPDWTGIYFSE